VIRKLSSRLLTLSASRLDVPLTRRFPPRDSPHHCPFKPLCNPPINAFSPHPFSCQQQSASSHPSAAESCSCVKSQSQTHQVGDQAVLRPNRGRTKFIALTNSILSCISDLRWTVQSNKGTAAHNQSSTHATASETTCLKLHLSIRFDIPLLRNTCAYVLEAALF
jgi:hypothetical protein